MTSFMEKGQRESYGRRKAKKRKCYSSKNKFKERGRMLLRVNNLHWWCLLIFVVQSLACVASLTVDGQKGTNITLPCNLKDQKNVDIVLTFGSKYLYGVRQDAEYKLRVHKSGNCDLILQGLKTTDAGIYILTIYDNGQNSLSYEVHVKYNLTKRKGEELVFDDLPREAEKVEHHTDTGSTEMWKRGQDDNRLTDKNGSLTISDLTSSNAGEYRVLNSTGGFLVTINVTVTESDLTEISNKQGTSGSSKTGVGWIAALPFLTCLFIGYL